MIWIPTSPTGAPLTLTLTQLHKTSRRTRDRPCRSPPLRSARYLDTLSGSFFMYRYTGDGLMASLPAESEAYNPVCRARGAPGKCLCLSPPDYLSPALLSATKISAPLFSSPPAHLITRLSEGVGGTAPCFPANRKKEPRH